MKSIWIISCRSPHVCNILNGLKTQELRTRIGNIKEGDEMHLYCTKSRPWLFRLPKMGKEWYTEDNIPDGWMVSAGSNFNGKVVAKFIVGKVEEISKEAVYPANEAVGHFVHTTQSMNNEQLLKASCLSQPELQKYIINSRGYSLSITQLSIFDKPRELGKYKKLAESYDMGATGGFMKAVTITRAPQSYMHAWVEE